MSLSDYLDLSLCDPSLPTDDDLSIEQFLEPFPQWFTGTESAGSASNNVNVLEPERYRSTTPRNLDEPTVWVSDLLEPSGLFPPLPSDVIPDVLKPSPHLNVFSPEDDDLDIYFSSNDSDDPVETPSAPVQRGVTSLPKLGKRSRPPSVISSEASYCTVSSLMNRTVAREEVIFNRTVGIKARKAAVGLTEPKDEPPAKKLKGRQTFNSACAPHDLASFPPVHNTDAIPSVVASSSLCSPLTSTSNSSDTSPLPKALVTKKRKFEEIDNNEDLEFTTEPKSQSDASEWEPVHEYYSRRTFHNKLQFRCTLCFEIDRVHLCSREGDMMRHLESLQHRPKSFFCHNFGCSSSFTRKDALKRHRNNCRA